MKIGIDISQIVYGTGVSVYTENLVNALLEIDKTNQYTLLFSSLRRKIDNSRFKIDDLRINKFKIPPTLLDILWNRLHILPVEHLIGEIDVFHSSDWTQPPAKKAKLITTIHDLSFLRWPNSVHPKVLAVQKRRLKWVRREANAVIAVSEATKREIIELLGIPKEKIFVIHEALPKDVGDIKDNGLRIDKNKYGITKPYIFAYGSQAPRKNIDRLIRAFKRISAKNRQLVIIGEYQPKQKVSENIVLTGFLPRNEMLSLFAGAGIFAYPSLYEGFGLPILEAFGMGVPVVTSNVSPMPEVAGDAAVLVNPKSVNEIAKGIEKAWDNKELVKKGRERLKLFSWREAAEKTIGVYEKVGTLGFN